MGTTIINFTETQQTTHSDSMLNKMTENTNNSPSDYGFEKDKLEYREYRVKK